MCARVCMCVCARVCVCACVCVCVHVCLQRVCHKCKNMLNSNDFCCLLSGTCFFMCLYLSSSIALYLQNLVLSILVMAWSSSSSIPDFSHAPDCFLQCISFATRVLGPGALRCCCYCAGVALNFPV